MSQENVENVKHAIAAFNRQDADAFVALSSPDVEWEDAMFWSGSVRIYHGREELRKWLDQVAEVWEDIQVELEEFTEAADDRAVVGLLITGRGKASGVAAPALHAWQVNWFVDGKTARRQAFLERGDALEAAGLSEQGPRHSTGRAT